MNFVKQILGEEKHNEELAYSKMGKTLELYEDIMDLCSKMVDSIADSTNKKFLGTSKLASFMITNRLLQSIQSIWHLTLKGYYYEASVLKRSYFEGLGLCIYLSENLEEAKNWTNGKRVKVTTIELFEIIPKAVFDVEAESGFKTIYGELCDFVHSNIRALVELVVFPADPNMFLPDGRKAKFVEIPIPFEFDNEKVAEIPLYPVLLVIALLKIFHEELGEKQIRKIKKLSNDYLRRCKEILDANIK